MQPNNTTAIGIAGTLATLSGVRRRLWDAYTEISAAMGAMGIGDPSANSDPTDCNPRDARQVSRAILACHSHATEATSSLSKAIGIGPKDPAAPPQGIELSAVAPTAVEWLAARNLEVPLPPAIAAVISMIDLPSRLPNDSLTYGARVRLALEILRSTQAERFHPKETMAEFTATKAAIEATANALRTIILTPA